MNCKHYQEQILTVYIDGEMREDEKKRVETHLAACADCRRIYEEAVSMSRFVKAAVRPAVPAGIWQTIDRGLTAQNVPSRNPFAGFLEKARALGETLASLPRPVLGIGAGIPALAVIAAVLHFSHPQSHDNEKVYLSHQMLYLADADLTGSEIAGEEEDILGSSLEYFLMA